MAKEFTLLGRTCGYHSREKGGDSQVRREQVAPCGLPVGWYCLLCAIFSSVEVISDLAASTGLIPIIMQYSQWQIRFFSAGLPGNGRATSMQQI